MSNVYPIWWDTTITIFNKYTDPQTRVVTWYKQVIPGAFWKYAGNKISINEITLDSNTIVCRIRKDDRFLEKYQWINLPNDSMKDYFTLGTGDIIVKGEVEDEIDEYTSGKRSTDLVKKYKNLQGCMEIQKVAIDTGEGRCMEHYYVVGE